MKAPLTYPNSSLSSRALRDASAVDRDEGRRGALAAVVDGPGHQLLARAALAGDQHRGRSGGGLGDGAEDLVHGLRFTQQAVPRLMVCGSRSWLAMRSLSLSSARRTAENSSSSVKGLVRYSSAPALMASTAPSTVA